MIGAFLHVIVNHVCYLCTFFSAGEGWNAIIWFTSDFKIGLGLVREKRSLWSRVINAQQLFIDHLFWSLCVLDGFVCSLCTFFHAGIQQIYVV